MSTQKVNADMRDAIRQVALVVRADESRSAVSPHHPADAPLKNRAGAQVSYPALCVSRIMQGILSIIHAFRE